MSIQSPAWGARGRVFESLRPDHIIQGVARFYLATLFLFLIVFTPTKPLALYGILTLLDELAPVEGTVLVLPNDH
jgi:hypothetical protein